MENVSPNESVRIPEAPGSHARTLRALVLDDDEWALRLIRYVLEEAVPGVAIEERQTPDIEGDFDVYVVDNDFDGALWATRMVPSIRERFPDALIVAFSATLDRATLKALLNAGCDVALEKGRPDDLEALSRVARDFARSDRKVSWSTQGILGSIDSIRGLIREWNLRLSREEEAARGA